MKVKELMEKLKGYEEFELTTTIAEYDSAGKFSYNTYEVAGICDIAHSDKVIDLDCEYKGVKP